MNNPHTKNHRPLLEGCSRAWQHCLSHQVQKNDGNSNQFINDEPFINKRKPSRTTVAKGVSNNGEHKLIPVTAKMIHSAVWDSERFVLKDGRLFHIVNSLTAKSVLVGEKLVATYSIST
jgi:hypothetical protein